MELIECIPNISEGQNIKTIETMANAIDSTPGVNLLNVDPGYAANRTVFTFTGSSDAVISAATKLVKLASELIDMRSQKGEHPRMGAVDVCPFVPISGITEDELALKVSDFAQSVSQNFGLPVYLYEHNSSQQHRKRLEQIRKGEYESIQDKMKLPDWEPDFWQGESAPHFGAMVTGVRKFLIAYNINLNSSNITIAKQIAESIRESGKLVKNKDGSTSRIPGKFKSLKAIGWFIDDFKCAQVSMNLTDYSITGLGEVFDTVKSLAEKLGTGINGSELIGLIPFEAIQGCANHYGFEGSVKETIRFVEEKLGLKSVKEFDANKQVLEIAAGVMQLT